MTDHPGHGQSEGPITIVEEIDDGLWCIDLQFQREPNVIAAWLMAGEDELALIETGPSSTL